MLEQEHVFFRTHQVGLSRKAGMQRGPSSANRVSRPSGDAQAIALAVGRHALGGERRFGAASEAFWRKSSSLWNTLNGVFRHSLPQQFLNIIPRERRQSFVWPLSGAPCIWALSPCWNSKRLCIHPRLCNAVHVSKLWESESFCSAPCMACRLDRIGSEAAASGSWGGGGRWALFGTETKEERLAHLRGVKVWRQGCVQRIGVSSRALLSRAMPRSLVLSISAWTLQRLRGHDLLVLQLHTTIHSTREVHRSLRAMEFQRMSWSSDDQSCSSVKLVHHDRFEIDGACCASPPGCQRQVKHSGLDDFAVPFVSTVQQRCPTSLWGGVRLGASQKTSTKQVAVLFTSCTADVLKTDWAASPWARKLAYVKTGQLEKASKLATSRSSVACPTSKIGLNWRDQPGHCHLTLAPSLPPRSSITWSHRQIVFMIFIPSKNTTWRYPHETGVDIIGPVKFLMDAYVSLRFLSSNDLVIPSSKCICPDQRKTITLNTICILWILCVTFSFKSKTQHDESYYFLKRKLITFASLHVMAMIGDHFLSFTIFPRIDRDHDILFDQDVQEKLSVGSRALLRSMVGRAKWNITCFFQGSEWSFDEKYFSMSRLGLDTSIVMHCWSFLTTTIQILLDLVCVSFPDFRVHPSKTHVV